MRTVANPTGTFLPEEEVVRLLETFPERGGFTVQTNIDIKQVNYDPDRDLWIITSIDGKRFESRAVVMAIGGCRIPVIPKWEGMETFPGEIIHSSKFKNAQDFSGKHVLVIGTGNSAADFMGSASGARRTEEGLAGVGS